MRRKTFPRLQKLIMAMPTDIQVRTPLQTRWTLSCRLCVCGSRLCLECVNWPKLNDDALLFAWPNLTVHGQGFHTEELFPRRVAHSFAPSAPGANLIVP